MAVFGVKGNHDSDKAFEAPIRDLHLTTANFGGMSFGGFNGSWRYKRTGHFLYDQEEAERLLSAMPPVDIFVSHNSPWGIHDCDDSVHYGFKALNQYIQRASPRFLFHGHQHLNRETLVGTTHVIGVFGCLLMEV
jgi:Icc-related predicted phosphoesterase